MFNFKRLSILFFWILNCLVSSKPIGICKTYFSIIGIEGDAMNGQTLCSQTEIPFVYFVLKCNDSNSLICAKNLQWTALSVCDKANVHHEEIPVTTALNTVDTTELSIELALYIQTEDEVTAVDEFYVKAKIDPNDDNLKTIVNAVGRYHNTKLEVEFHRICSLPDTLRSPLQVISYMLRHHPKSRRKRQAVSLEYPDPDIKPSVSTYNRNPYLNDPFPLSRDDTEIRSGPFNDLQKDRTTETPFKQFWSSVAKQQGIAIPNSPTYPAPPITTGLRNPYITPGAPLTTLKVSDRRLSEMSGSNVLEDFLNSQKSSSISTTTDSSPRVTPRFITRSDISQSTFKSSIISPTTTLPTTVTPKPTSLKSDTTTASIKIETTTIPQTPEKTTQATTSISTSTTTTTQETSPKIETTSSSIKSTTRKETTTATVTSTYSPTSTQKLTLSTKSPSTKPTSTATTPKTTSSTTSTQKPPKSTEPTTKEQTTKKVITEPPKLHPVTEDKAVGEKSTSRADNSTENLVSTESSINTPSPSVETDTSASSSSSRMESTGDENDNSSDDNFWPIVAAMVIGIPSVIVFAIAITVIHKKRLGRAPRFMSSSMYPSL